MTDSDFDTVLERVLTDQAFLAALAADPSTALAGYRLTTGELDLLRAQVSLGAGAPREVEARTSKASMFGLLAPLEHLAGFGHDAPAGSAAAPPGGVTQGFGPAPVQGFAAADATQGVEPADALQHFGPAGAGQHFGTAGARQHFGPADAAQGFGPAPVQGLGPADATQGLDPAPVQGLGPAGGSPALADLPGDAPLPDHHLGHPNRVDPD
jgi:hypothetical protein